MSSRLNRIRLSAAALLVTAAWPGFASAQESHDTTPAGGGGAAGDETSGRGLQDITVTARRTNERLQTVPVAVTAIDSAALAQRQIVSLADLQAATPNLSVAVGGAGPSTAVYVFIRGSGQIAPSSTSDPSVGTYIDGVYYARPTGGNLDLFDVASAEVLRGPQGTLFGRNTTGGAISITTNQPTDKFEGMVRGEIGNYAEHRVEGVLNVPLADDLAVRISSRYEEHDGYGRFVNINRDADKLDGDIYTHITLRWSPGSSTVISLSGDYEKLKDDGKLDATVAVNPAFNLGGGLTVGTLFGLLGFDPSKYIVNARNFYKNYGYGDTGVSLYDTPFDRSVSKGVSSTIEQDLGTLQAKSITAYRVANTSDVQDLDALPIGIASLYGVYRDKQFSEELQILSSSGPLHWIVGGYYFIEKGYEEADTVLLPALLGNRPSQSDSGNTRNASYAVFGQVNYDITDRLRATGGIRYTWDTRKLIRHSRIYRDDPASCQLTDLDVPGGPCSETNNAHFSYPAWTAGLDYKATDDLFLYVKTSGASVAGGWNIRTTIAPAFKPENLRDLEIGIKSQFLDRRLRINVAGFYAWQSDVQRLVNFASGTQTLTASVINAGKVHVRGVEGEITAVPWQGMEITSGLAYQKADYVTGTFTEPQLVDGVVVTVDRSRELVPNAPKFTANVGATQSVPLSFGKASIHADFAYISSRAFFQSTPAPNAAQAVKDEYEFANQYGVAKGYGLLNARAALELKSGVELAVFAKNLTRKRYFTALSDYLNSLGVASATQGAPRTYGLSVGFRW